MKFRNPRHGFGTAPLWNQHTCLVGLALAAVCSAWALPSLAQERASALRQQAPPAQTTAEKSEKLFSGPQVGEALQTAEIWLVPEDATQPSTKVDMAELADKQPLAIAFLHEKTRPAFQFAKLMSAYSTQLQEQKKPLPMYFVVLSDDRPEAEKWLRQIRRYFDKQVNLAVADGGIEGPGTLGLNRQSQLTIVLAKDKQVRANFAFTQPSTNVDGPSVLQAMSDMVQAESPPQVEKLLPAPMRRK